MPKHVPMISPGDLFLPRRDGSRASHRRVLAVVKLSTRAKTLFCRPVEQVIYSSGGDRNHQCSARQMYRWGARKENQGDE